MNINISELMASAAQWELVGYGAAAIVVLGIIMESIDLLRDFSSIKKGERKLELIGILLVLIGLVAEVITQVQSYSKTGLVIVALGVEAKEADSKAADALKQAAILGVSQKNLHDLVANQEQTNNSIIEELKRSTENLEKARNDAIASADSAKNILAEINNKMMELKDTQDKVRKITTPRILSENQSSELTVALKPMAKISFDISANLDLEPYDFAKQIGFALKKSGWDWEPRNTFPGLTTKDVPNIGGTVSTGIHVEACLGDQTAMEPYAAALREALKRDGFLLTGLAYPDSDATTKNEKCGVLHIFVGSKY